MRKNYSTRKKRRKHILAELRQEIGRGRGDLGGQRRSQDSLGIPCGTLCHIENGSFPFSRKTAQKISTWTGLSVGCLLANAPRKKWKTTDGQQWTVEGFKRLEKQRNDQQELIAKIPHAGDSIWALDALTGSLIDTLLVVHVAGDSIGTCNRLMRILYRVRNRFPAKCRAYAEEIWRSLPGDSKLNVNSTDGWLSLRRHMLLALGAIKAAKKQASNRKSLTKDERFRLELPPYLE
jgi:hypothetical protein